jgi:hypothetical protein
MAGLFSRLKIWNPGEDLTASDLNGEFNHFLSNIDAEHSEGYSANLSEMQTTEDPGGLGSENLTQPISVAQEIERLRYVVSRIVGKSYWYQNPSESLEGLNSTVSGIFNVKPTRIVSGAESTLSGFPKFLQANGATGVRLNASVGVPFSCFIDAVSYNLTSNVDSGVLSAQPANNTAVLASSLGGGQASREATEFTISSVGAAITASIGRQQIFSIVNGANTEYFLGTITSATTIGGIKRGYFYDTSNLPISPIALTTGHTITMLKTTYVFLKTDGTLSASYNPPTYNGIAPVSPAINDYWYDMTVDTWKIYNGNWVVANAIFVGMCAQGPVNTVCARSDDFFLNFSSLNGIVLKDVTNTSVSTRDDVAVNVSVYGSVIRSDFKDYLWDITQNLFPGETETSSTTYYLYLNKLGTPYLSSVKPVTESTRYGLYHPNEALRSVGFVFNDSSSNLTAVPQNYEINYSFQNLVTVQKFTSGSGTYTTPYGTKYIRVRLVGGGGGGSGGNQGSASTAGGNGTDTTFSTLTAAGGQGGQPSSGTLVGVGGYTLGAATGGNVVNIRGSFGTSGIQINSASGQPNTGGVGGTSPFGGAGGGSATIVNGAAVANSGSGGGGGGSSGTANTSSGGGGQAGGYIEHLIISPSLTYSYSVGAGGTGGAGQGAGAAGGAGGSGVIIVEEYYV